MERKLHDHELKRNDPVDLIVNICFFLLKFLKFFLCFKDSMFYRLMSELGLLF